MATATGHTITLHDLRHDTDEEIVERVAFANLLRREELPDDPPIDVAQMIAATRSMPEGMRRLTYRARDEGGSLVGNATAVLDVDEDNPDVLMVAINVLPQHRRRGLGRRLLGHVAALAREEGRTRLVGGTAIEAGARFMEAAGAAPRLANHLNHLPLGEVDRSMLERWVRESATRAAGYELVGWDGPVPEEHVDAWLDLVLVMNTAPLDDLELNDSIPTEAKLRDHERLREVMGIEAWTLVARHRATGAWVGFHDVTWDPAQPPYVWVGATGVRPEHRGHALGKWLKAAMTLRILDERPTVTHVRTGNADSNDAMLGINRAMGYRPLIAQMTWELPVAAAAAWAQVHGAPTSLG